MSLIGYYWGMESNEDIRWVQRFSNYRKALANLERAVAQGEYNELERQGLIKAFEICYELAWKTLQDVLRFRGHEEIAGPKPVLRMAFSDGLIADGQLWADLHEARNLASHVYDLARAESLELKIRNDFIVALRELETKLANQ